MKALKQILVVKRRVKNIALILEFKLVWKIIAKNDCIFGIENITVFFGIPRFMYLIVLS